MNFSLIIFFFLVVILSRNVEGTCKICSTVSGVACVSETEFQVCSSNVPFGEVLSCPLGTNCGVSSAICTMSSPDCQSQCGKCDKESRFACISQNEFAFCFGNSTPSSTTASCPIPGSVCNNALTSFGGDPSTTIANCPESSTTPTPLCPGPGRFPVPGDTTCKQYIYCFYVNSVLKAQIYTCEGQTSYCHSMQLCITRPTPIQTCTC